VASIDAGGRGFEHLDGIMAFVNANARGSAPLGGIDAGGSDGVRAGDVAHRRNAEQMARELEVGTPPESGKGHSIRFSV
jgi:hypothetical protein